MNRSARHGFFWPTPRERALLEITLGPAEKAAERWQALQPLDVATLEFGSLPVLPVLYERLRDVAPEEPQLARLLGTYRSVWYRNQLLLDRLSVLLPLLRERAHTEPLLVGGMSSVLRWYPRLGLRPVPQLELIVERDAAEDAVRVAGYAGWRATHVAPVFTRLRDKSGRVLFVHHGAPRVVAGGLAEEGLTRLRERAVELTNAVGMPIVLGSADEALFLCAFGARTKIPRSYQWLIDIYSLLGSGDIRVAEVVERARLFHLVEQLRASLLYLAEFCELPIVIDLLVELNRERTSRRERLAFRLAGASGSRVAPLAQAIALHLQATADEPLPRVFTRLPGTFQESWGVTGPLAAYALALKKTGRLVRPAIQAGSAERRRSASS